MLRGEETHPVAPRTMRGRPGCIERGRDRLVALIPKTKSRQLEGVERRGISLVVPRTKNGRPGGIERGRDCTCMRFSLREWCLRNKI